MDNLYNWIEALGKERGFKTVTSLCRKADMSPSTLTELKSGRTKKLTTGTAEKLAAVLNVPIDYLLKGGVSTYEVTLKSLKEETGDTNEQKISPTPQKGIELNPEYFNLSPENRDLVDALILKLSKSQSEP